MTDIVLLRGKGEKLLGVQNKTKQKNNNKTKQRER